MNIIEIYSAVPHKEGITVNSELDDVGRTTGRDDGQCMIAILAPLS